jgi:signal transduction histidine kinase
MSANKQPRSLLIFYILIGYVTLQLAWWTYLIIDLLNEAYPTQSVLRSKTAMVLGELAVFLLLLAIAVWQLRKSFRKELALNRRERNFLSSVTHELKSPVAVAQLNIQTLLKRDLDKEKQKDLLKRTLKEANRLEDLIANMLMASSLEERRYQLHPEDSNLSAFLHELVQDSAQGIASAHTIDAQIQPDIVLRMDLSAFRSIATNLISNAVKYSPKESVIRVSLHKQADQVLLSVADQGIGIQKEAFSRIFRKFHREGNEDVRRTKGTGLGLFIVQQLTTMTGGTIALESSRGNGSTFTISWKISQS